MTVSEHLEQRLRHSALHHLSDGDRAFIETKGIEAFIYRTLTNKKFRKWSIDDETKKSVAKTIHLNVIANGPIQLTFPFGGYKLWRLPSAPEVDWAEFFTISFYSAYVAPILASYPPGVLFSFSSDDMIVERMDNVPASETDAYIHSFRTLLQQFEKNFPENLHIELVRVADMYPDTSEYEHDLAEHIPIYEKKFAAMDSATREKKLKTSALNIRWDGARDLTGLSESEKQTMIERGPILHDAHCAVPRRRAFVRGEDKIIVFSNPNANSIPIGTTKSSRTKFWTGIGVLEQRDGEFLDRILSPEQWEKIKDVEHQIVPVDLVPLRNFSEISVFDRQFDFGAYPLP